MDCSSHVEAFIVSEPIPGSFGADAVAHLEGNDLSTFDDDGHDSTVADKASRLPLGRLTVGRKTS